MRSGALVADGSAGKRIATRRIAELSANCRIECPMSPTPFQVQLHYEAVQLLVARKVAFESGTVQRGDEIALTAKFNDMELYIFRDGANVVSPLLRRDFEKKDYKTFEALKAACLEYLAGLLPND